HKLQATLGGQKHHAVERRLAQYRQSRNQTFRLQLASEIITGKIRQQRHTLQSIGQQKTQLQHPMQQAIAFYVIVQSWEKSGTLPFFHP
ncbi:MAG: CRISPR-associated endonuclease Cas1, partial [Gammaproteobacteria bacterium]|nr:CRISPR-associated endonuclease Cas1 [Gammaproteobacteria bacterium]